MEAKEKRAVKNVVKIAVDDLQINFFVRKSLNDDHVLFLGGLYEAGQQLPPITVCSAENGKYEIIDGRHRLEAQKLLLDRDKVECEIVEGLDTNLDIYLNGLKANLGGSLPPSRGDLTMVIKRLIEGGTAQRDIRAKLCELLPPVMVRRYIDDALSEMAKAKMNRAINAVVNGDMTVTVAAKEYGVDLKKLREQISGKKKKAAPTLKNLKAGLSHSQQGHTRRSTNVLRDIAQRYEDGEITIKQATEIFDHAESLLKNALHTYQECRQRLNTVANGSSATKEA